MRASVEVSLYPLKTLDVTPAIVAFIDVMRDAGLHVRTGPMSTLVEGESAVVFPALQRAYDTCCADSAAVLVMKVTNVGPPVTGSG